MFWAIKTEEINPDCIGLVVESRQKAIDGKFKARFAAVYISKRIKDKRELVLHLRHLANMIEQDPLM